MKINQKGFSLAVLLMAFVVLGIVGLVLYRVMSNDGAIDNQSNTVQSVTPNEEIAEATKLFENKDFNFMLTVPETWKISDDSVYEGGEPLQLYVSAITGDNTGVKIYQTVGKGGDCQPKPGDSPHAEGNTCNTQEYIKADYVGDGGVLSRFRFTGTKGGVKFGYCYKNGQNSVPQLNSPQMGFVLPCGPDELTIEIDGLSSQSAYDTDNVKAIEEVLLTINFTE